MSKLFRDFANKQTFHGNNNQSLLYTFQTLSPQNNQYIIIYMISLLKTNIDFT